MSPCTLRTLSCRSPAGSELPSSILDSAPTLLFTCGKAPGGHAEGQGPARRVEACTGRASGLPGPRRGRPQHACPGPSSLWSVFMGVWNARPRSSGPCQAVRARCRFRRLRQCMATAPTGSVAREGPGGGVSFASFCSSCLTYEAHVARLPPAREAGLPEELVLRRRRPWGASHVPLSPSLRGDPGPRTDHDKRLSTD